MSYDMYQPDSTQRMGMILQNLNESRNVESSSLNEALSMTQSTRIELAGKDRDKVAHGRTESQLTEKDNGTTLWYRIGDDFYPLRNVKVEKYNDSLYGSKPRWVNKVSGTDYRGKYWNSDYVRGSFLYFFTEAEVNALIDASNKKSDEEARYKAINPADARSLNSKYQSLTYKGTYDEDGKSCTCSLRFGTTTDGKAFRVMVHDNEDGLPFMKGSFLEIYYLPIGGGKVLRHRGAFDVPNGPEWFSDKKAKEVPESQIKKDIDTIRKFITKPEKGYFTKMSKAVN